MTRGQEVFAIMHSDARATPKVIDCLLDAAEALTEAGRRWGVFFTNYDVLCLHNTAVLKDFRWDPYLPVYFTDVDFYRRLRLAGVELVETGLPVEHREGGSTTMKADAALAQFVACGYPAWEEYYRRKWGGGRGEERYATPFDMPINLPMEERCGLSNPARIEPVPAATEPVIETSTDDPQGQPSSQERCQTAYPETRHLTAMPPLSPREICP
jgi:hypothetical protein